MTLSSLLPGSKFVLKAGFHITLDDSLKLFLCDIDRSITTSHVQNVAIKRPQVIATTFGKHTIYEADILIVYQDHRLGQIKDIQIFDSRTYLECI